MKAKIKKGDEVVVIAGKDKGKSGKVLKVSQSLDRAVVEGINLVKKHQKPTQANQKGGIEERESAVHLSNLMLVCPTTKKPTRVGIKITDSGERLRVSKRSNAVID